MLELEIPFLDISSFTNSIPILSNLSSAVVKSIILFSAPINSTIPDKIFLLLILTHTPFKFKSEKTASYS